jgi:hypothetical protein
MLHGLIHPEAGTLLPQQPKEDPFGGFVPLSRRLHGRTVHGARDGKKLGRLKLKPCPPITRLALEAKYLAWGVCNLIYTFSRSAWCWAGESLAPGLIDMVRQQIVNISNGYVIRPK